MQKKTTILTLKTLICVVILNKTNEKSDNVHFLMILSAKKINFSIPNENNFIFTMTEFSTFLDPFCAVRRN